MSDPILIVVYRDLAPELIQKIKAVHEDIKVVASTDEAELEEYWPQAEIVFCWKLEADTLAKCKKLRWIQSVSTGIDFFLYPEFLERDIVLTNVKKGQTISEHIFMMMLAHARKLKTYMLQQQSRTWKPHPVSLLHGKNLLVIGLGSVGQTTARIAAAFGMRVEGMANTPKNLPFLEKTYTPDMLHQALPSADYIVVAIPLTEKSEGMLGEAEFSLMKEGAYVVNIGRGGIVHEEAVIRAIKEKRISGAGLDVFHNEPLEDDSPLWEMDEVIITPHMAGSNPASRAAAVDVFCANLRRYLEGRQLDNVVDREAGY